MPEPLGHLAVATDLADDAGALLPTALGLALVGRRRGPVCLSVLHVGPPSDLRGALDVRSTLVRWRVLDATAGVEEFERLGLRVRGVPLSPGIGDVRRVLLDALDDLDPELLVVGTHGHAGLDRLLHRSVAEPVARASLVPTLVVRNAARALVDPETGATRIRRVLVPVDSSVPGQPVIDALERLLGRWNAGPVSFTFVHVGGAGGVPSLRVPDRSDWVWQSERVDGGVVDGILSAADAAGADLIAMGTLGHHGLLDALRGDTTERVFRRAPCPVLVVPILAPAS